MYLCWIQTQDIRIDPDLKDVGYAYSMIKPYLTELKEALLIREGFLFISRSYEQSRKRILVTHSVDQ